MRNFFSSFFSKIETWRKPLLFSAHAEFFKRLFFAFFLFLICYLCIFAVLSMKKNAEMKFRHFLSVLEENNVNIVNPQVSLIMPALKFDELSHAAYPDIMIEQGKLELSLWNKEINLTGALAKGKITAAVTSDALFSPKQITARATFENIDLKDIKNSFPLQTLIGINSGTANFNAYAAFQLQNAKPDLFSMDAACKGNVTNADVINHIPILNRSDIANGNLSVDLRLNKSKLDYCDISFKSDIISAEVNGTADLDYHNLRQSALNFNAVVKIDKNDINQELTPKNTRRSILEKNEVRMKITGSPNSPNVNVL